MKKNIIFDLGGVLFELDFKNSISRLLNSNENDFQKLFQKWLFSPSIREFESGKISYEDFFTNMTKEFDLNLSLEDFTKEFKNIVVGPFKETEELLNTLKNKEHNIYLLSNITNVHWEMISSYDYINNNVTKPFLSYKIGVAKPEDEIFKHVLNEIDTDLDIIYFDDNESNVESANRNGLKSFHTVGLSEVISKLKELDII
jgi:HAD superfamily hydrolase (TIGR01509 family)